MGTDLVADQISSSSANLFPAWCVLSLACRGDRLGLYGTLHGAIGGFVWGGLVRVFLLHHSTLA